MEYRARGIKKSFGGIAALKGVDFAARPRSVHAVIGENGAGKSTLLKILAGAMAPDEGSLEMDGELLEFTTTAQAQRQGIAMVSQELSLFPDIDLVGNLFPLGPPTRLGVIDRDEVERRSRDVLDDLGVHRHLRTPVGELKLAEQQLVEIARAVITDPKVLILDEPTSALDREDVGHVHQVLHVLKSRGVAVIYVSHILEDVMDHVDEITVLRDGEVAVAAAPAGSMTMSEMILAMVGRGIEARTAAPRVIVEGASLGVKDLEVGNANGVSFEVAPGEVVGLAGLAGAGHHDVFEALTGTAAVRSGEVILPTGHKNPDSIRSAVLDGVAVVPGDRKKLGLHLEAPIWENVAHVRSVALAGVAGVVRRQPLIDRASKRIEQLKIAAPSPTVPTSSLSGGNQQKVVFAKWAEAESSVILMDDPTRGIDVGGRTEVWALIDSLAETGAIQVVLSSDPLELASICHRVLVFRDGRIAAELTGEAITHANILEAMNRDLEIDG